MRIAFLKQDFPQNGKSVFAAVYLTDPAKAQRFIDAATADGFTPYVAPSRDLDTLSAPTSVPEPTALLMTGTLAALNASAPPLIVVAR